MNKKVLFILISILLPLGLRAQEAHWTCSYSDFDNDMRLYVALELDDERITDLSNYDIAAFCGDECRGFVDRSENGILDTGNGQVAYIIIYSNTIGETITFKAYDKTTEEEFDLQDGNRQLISVTFVKDGVTGSGSSPLILSFPPKYTPGDVNGDGEIDIDDVYLVIDLALGREVVGAIEPAADITNDGVIDIDDVYSIIDKALGR